MSLLKHVGNEENGKSSQGSASDKQTSDSTQHSSQQGFSHSDMQRVQQRFLSELDPSMDITRPEEVRRTIQEIYEQILAEENIVLDRLGRARLFEQIAAEILGYGPLQPILEDRTATEIMVNGPKHIYIEREGKIYRVPITFEDNDHLMRIINRILDPLGISVDEQHPYASARLPDGSRVYIIIPPASLIGPVLTIRKLRIDNPVTIEEIQSGLFSSNPEALHYVAQCVQQKKNIIISGGMGSGKTTLVNFLSSFFDSSDRIFTVEDVAELLIRDEHVISLEASPPTGEGRSAITCNDLLVASMQMRPDRIILGEIKDYSGPILLQYFSSCNGLITTINSDSIYGVVSRLEQIIQMSGYFIPQKTTLNRLGSSIDLIIHLEKFRDGSRKIITIGELSPASQEGLEIRELYRYVLSKAETGKITGKLTPTGEPPIFMNQV
jgi:pilus assembly protein CpaF